MAGTYLTPCTPTATTGMLMKPETCIKVGTSARYGSLDVTSWTYTTYGISIGLQAGGFFQLGIIADLSFSHVPSYEEVESFNVADNSIYEVSGEETTVSVEIRQFDARMMEIAIGTGSMITLGNERAIPFGGACSMILRPYSLEFTNDSCWAPTAQDVSLGLTGGAITIYEMFVSSGLEWAMNAKEGSTIPLELQALPVLERVSGRRLGVVYLY